MLRVAPSEMLVGTVYLGEWQTKVRDLVEAIRGSALSDEVMLQVQKIGMLIILGIMMLAIYVDLGRFFGNP